MYYEEKTINAILHFRTTPKGEWIEMSKENMTSKIHSLGKRLAALEAACATLNLSGKFVGIQN